MILFYIIFIFIIILAITAKKIETFMRSTYIANIDKKMILITGCDSGFGYELAIQLDTKGVNVMATCKTEMGLQRLKNTGSKNLRCYLLDVTKREDITKLKNSVFPLLQCKGLHGLVNNAGKAIITTPTTSISLENQTEKEDFLKIYSINTVAAIRMSVEFLPFLNKCGGRIVNIASSLGRLAIPMEPTLIAYCLSQYANEGLADCLRHYLQDNHPNVTCHLIEAGFYKTELFNSVEGAGNVKKLDKKYKQTYPKILNKCRINLHEVIDAYEHALFSTWPRIRYSCGSDFRFKYLPISYLPSYIGDLLLRTKFSQ